MSHCCSPIPKHTGSVNIHHTAAIVTVEIYRDGPDAPWGFRLRGGLDVDGGTPLEITKVRPNTYNI